MPSGDYVPHYFNVPAAEFWWPTAFFFGLAVVLSLCSLALKKNDRSTMIVTSVGSCMCFWLLWFCTFAMQINPLIDPEITLS